MVNISVPLFFETKVFDTGSNLNSKRKGKSYILKKNQSFDIFINFG